MLYTTTLPPCCLYGNRLCPERAKRWCSREPFLRTGLRCYISHYGDDTSSYGGCNDAGPGNGRAGDQTPFDIAADGLPLLSLQAGANEAVLSARTLALFSCLPLPLALAVLRLCPAHLHIIRRSYPVPSNSLKAAITVTQAWFADDLPRSPSTRSVSSLAATALLLRPAGLAHHPTRLLLAIDRVGLPLRRPYHLPIDLSLHSGAASNLLMVIIRAHYTRFPVSGDTLSTTRCLANTTRGKYCGRTYGTMRYSGTLLLSHSYFNDWMTPGPPLH